MSDLIEIPEGWQQLTPRQQSFLAQRPLFPTDRKCAEVVGIPWETVNNWHSNVAFQTAYNALADQILAATRREFVLMVQEAANQLAEALTLEADDQLQVKVVNTRLRAVELLLKANGMLSGDIQVNMGQINGITADALMKGLREARNITPE